MNNVVFNFTPFEKQQEFLIATENRQLYGGSAGGGKSAALVMKSYLYASAFAKAHIGLFRESYGQAKESLYYKFLEFIPEFCPTTGRRLWKWRESEMQFILDNGSRISLNYMQNYDDAQKYQGAEFDVIGVDELTKHDKKTIDFILTRLRSAKNKKARGKTQFWATSNPGDKGHLWVRKMFVKPTENGTKRVIRVFKNHLGEEFRTSYRYIKSTLYDNPHLAGTDYEANLLGLPKHLQELFLHGNWEVAEGQFLTNFQYKEHVYKKGEIQMQPHWKVFLHMDWGHNDNYELGFTFHDEKNYKYLDKEVSGNRTSIQDMADIILDEIETYGFKLNIQSLILPHDMFRKKDVDVRDGKGDIIGETSAEILENLTGIFVTRAPTGKGIRKEGWRKVHALMYFNRSKMERLAEEGKISLEDIRPQWRINESCINAIEQIQSVVLDPDNPEDIEDGQEDHAIDMIRYYAVGTDDNEFSVKPEEKVNKNTIGYVKQKLIEKEEMDNLSALYG